MLRAFLAVSGAAWWRVAIGRVMDLTDFHRIKRLPPHVFNIVGDLVHKTRRGGEDMIHFGVGNPEGRTPPHVVANFNEGKVAIWPAIGFGEFGDPHVRFAPIANEQRTRQAFCGIRQALSQASAATIRPAG